MPAWPPGPPPASLRLSDAYGVRHAPEIEPQSGLVPVAQSDYSKLVSMRVHPVLVHAKAARHLRSIRKSEPQLRPDDVPHLLDNTGGDRLNIGARELEELLIRVVWGSHAASPVVLPRREPATRAASPERNDFPNSVSLAEPNNFTPRTWVEWPSLAGCPRG
jgi:hypothetical protein